MTNKFNKIAAILAVTCLVLASSGCATTRLPLGYKVEGKEYISFKDLGDDQAMKMFALIYNIKTDEWADGVAKSLALSEFRELLKKRKSKYIKSSGIFDVEFEKVDLKKWTDHDLVKVYEALEPKAKAYYESSAANLTEEENATRVMYLTAMSAIVKDLQKRETTRSAMQVAGEVLTIALSVALSLI